MLAAGLIVGRDGPVGPGAPYRPREFLWFHRDLPDEVPVPFAVDVLHRDDEIVVVDKPHFLATIPRGRHVAETALVRLRRELGLPELSPAHRLDRVTAGVLLFVVRRDRRGAYQTLFRDRRVHKTYEAVAPYDPAVPLPHDRVQPDRQGARGDPRPRAARAAERGDPHRADRARATGCARYRLTPLTGRTHQLRLHMRGLGLPILGDRFYGGGPSAEPETPRSTTGPARCSCWRPRWSSPTRSPARRARFASRRTLQALHRPGRLGRGAAGGALIDHSQQVRVSSKE